MIRVSPPWEPNDLGRVHDGNVTRYGLDGADVRPGFRLSYGPCWLCQSTDVVAYDRAKPNPARGVNCFYNLCEDCIKHSQEIVGIANGSLGPTP